MTFNHFDNHKIVQDVQYYVHKNQLNLINFKKYKLQILTVLVFLANYIFFKHDFVLGFKIFYTYLFL